MGNIESITVGEIVTAISVISVFVMAYSNINKTIKEKIKPTEELKDRIEKCEEHLDNDNKKFKDLDQCQKLTLKAVRLLLDERIANDDESGRLAKMKNDIDEYLLK